VEELPCDYPLVNRIPALAPAPRLTLRRWELGDAEALNAAVFASLDHLRPFMPWAQYEPLTLDARRDLIRDWEGRWEAGGDLVLGAFAGDAIVGGCGLHLRSGGPASLEIGYWVHVAHLRLGYATEMSEALTHLAFGIEEIERVEIHHDKANVASAGVPRGLGFERLPESPDEITAPGEIGIDCAWVVTREAWTTRCTRRKES
jgi:ribosomal-protein-serine acetyltransferase